MLYSALTNEHLIITDFETRLCSNGEQGDNRQTLAAAPTLQGDIAYYLITNGDKTPFALQTLHGILFGADAYGRNHDIDWLSEVSWLTADAVRSTIAGLPGHEHENFLEFADALEGLAGEGA